MCEGRRANQETAEGGAVAARPDGPGGGCRAPAGGDLRDRRPHRATATRGDGMGAGGHPGGGCGSRLRSSLGRWRSLAFHSVRARRASGRNQLRGRETSRAPGVMNPGAATIGLRCHFSLAQPEPQHPRPENKRSPTRPATDPNPEAAPSRCGEPPPTASPTHPPPPLFHALSNPRLTTPPAATLTPPSPPDQPRGATRKPPALAGVTSTRNHGQPAPPTARRTRPPKLPLDIARSPPVPR